MMPKIRVNPAATRNSSSPSCTPLRPCSIKSSMARPPNTGGGRTPPPASAAAFLPAHRALLVIAVLVVVDDLRDRAQRVLALRVLDRLLQIEALDREVVVAVAVRAAHRGVARLAKRVAHRVLLGEVALHG